jgi:hypothetical protein
MAKRKSKRHRYAGAPVLCDFDPTLGQLIYWNPVRKVAKIRRYSDSTIISRNTECVLFREPPEKTHSFWRGTLLCKVRKYEIKGREENKRHGFVITASWHQTYSTAYQGRHIGGEANTELYAIVIDEKVVFRPREYPEISQRLAAAAGPVLSELLCTL